MKKAWAYGLSSLFLAGTADAGGLYVGEPGTQAMERAGAFVAKADDPTALSLNPAGLLSGPVRAVYLGSAFIDYNLTYDRAGVYPGTTTAFPEMTNQANWQPVPYAAASARFGSKLAFGVGIYGPQGSPKRDFPCSFSDDSCQVSAGLSAPQRYDVVSQDAIIIKPSVAVAYRLLPSLDIGARFTWGIGNLKGRSFPWGNLIANNSEDPNSDGDFKLDVSDRFIPDVTIGVMFRPSSHWSFGAAWTSQSTFDASGTGDARLGSAIGAPLGQDYIEPVPDAQAACAPGGTVSELRACVTLIMPMTAVVGGRYIFRGADGHEKGDLELDVKWEQWSSASDITVVVDGRDHILARDLEPVKIAHGFQDVLSVRLGGSFELMPSFELRGGVSIDTAAAPDSWTRADLDGKGRQTLAVGAAYKASWAKIDAGIAYVHEGDITVDNTSTMGNVTQPNPTWPVWPDGTAFHPINAGTYKSGYFIGMVGVTAAF